MRKMPAFTVNGSFALIKVVNRDMLANVTVPLTLH